jgi:hypothetical protein
MSADPALADLPVVGPSFALGNRNLVGDVSAWLTYGNMHSYPGNQHPEWSLHPGPAGGGEFQRAAINSGAKPVMATETGYHNATAVSSGHMPVAENASAVYIPRLLLDYYARGVKRTFLYELIDQGTGTRNKEGRFGLLSHDLSEKPAFRAMQRLIGLLGDHGVVVPQEESPRNNPGETPPGGSPRPPSGGSPPPGGTPPPPDGTPPPPSDDPVPPPPDDPLPLPPPPDDPLPLPPPPDDPLPLPLPPPPTLPPPPSLPVATAAFTPGSLNYSLEGATPDIRRVLLQKSDGSFWLALWREAPVWDGARSSEVSAPEQPVTVRLGQAFVGARAYRPGRSMTPTGTWLTPREFQVAVPADVVVLEFVPYPSPITPGRPVTCDFRARSNTRKKRRSRKRSRAVVVLRRARRVNRIVIRWPARARGHYRISTSAGGRRYRPVGTVVVCGGGRSVTRFPTRRVRRVRVRRIGAQTAAIRLSRKRVRLLAPRRR